MATRAAAGDSLTLPTALHSGGDAACASRDESPAKRFLGWATSVTAGRREGRGASGSVTATQIKWWKVHLFQGMVKDVRRRAPYYWSDWRDAWDYRVVPATVYMYFAK